MMMTRAINKKCLAEGPIWNHKVQYQVLRGEERSSNDPPNAQESQSFWKDIEGWQGIYNENVESLGNVVKELSEIDKQENIFVTKGNLSKYLRKKPTSKTHWIDAVHGLWHRKFTNIHQLLAEELHKWVVSSVGSSYMTENLKLLIQNTLWKAIWLAITYWLASSISIRIRRSYCQRFNKVEAKSYEARNINW